MHWCSFTKTFWILLCRKIRAQKLIHDTNSMLFSQPRFYPTFPLSCFWNSAMFPIVFYKLFNANSTAFLHRFANSTKILQNSQENTCTRVPFLIKLQAWGIKKETLVQVFSCEFFESSQNTFSYRPPPVAASDSFKCLFVSSHTLHFKLFTSTSTLFKSSFSAFNFVFRCSFLKTTKRKEKKKIYIENHKKIWEIVVLTDRCIIKKMISKKNVM